MNTHLTIVRKKDSNPIVEVILVMHPRFSSSSCHRDYLSRKCKPQEGENIGAAIQLVVFQRSAQIMQSALWQGLWCHMLQMAHFTGCSQRRTLQMNLSSSLNAPLIWMSLSQGWEFLSWKSTLLCFGLPFNKCLLGTFSFPWQHTQQ